MTKGKEPGGEVREFLLLSIPDHPRDVVRLACEKFGISRQAASRHLRLLIGQGFVRGTGNTKNRTYHLIPLKSHSVRVPLTGLAEDALWRKEAASFMEGLPANVLDIWQYAFTEMVNNAIDHSGGSHLDVKVERDAVFTQMLISDDGIGIFRKIQQDCRLEDERHAVLELAKGKLTTDPQHHTGEGIFFSSRMFDRYAILSGGVFFTHAVGEEEDWILETENPTRGTRVVMALSNRSARTAQEIFDAYADPDDDYGFTKTIVPVRLARVGAENLISRSQAKRLLARIDRFRVAVLDFAEVETIGQAFADEIFRVFVREHPEVQVVPVNAKPEVERMIRRARAHDQDGGAGADSESSITGENSEA